MNKPIKILIIALIVLCIIVFTFLFINKKEHTVVFIGDSITNYGTDSDYGFVNQFKKKYSSLIKIYAEGICGNETTDILERLDKDVIKHKPDVMYIMIGINDINNESRTLEEILQNMTKIIDIVKENNIEPVILNVTLISEDFSNPKNIQVDKYNELLKNLAEEKQVKLIDVNTLLKNEVNKGDNSSLVVMEDDLHLNENGNNVVADAVINEFEKDFADKWQLKQ